MLPIKHLSGENIHPSELPENRNRCALHDEFVKKMMPEMRKVLGERLRADPSSDFQKAWRIFLGTILGGKFYFVCHITEDFQTMQAYNCEDSTIPQYPVLLWGEAFHIKKSVMDQIKRQFPSHHEGKVPFQTALAIIPRMSRSHSTPQLSSLFSGEPVVTSNYEVSVMYPVGIESLSFRLENFPLQFWTHRSRYQVIKTALDDERKKPIQNEKLIAVYGKACTLEENWLSAENKRRESQKELGKKNKTLEKEEVSLQTLRTNSSVSKEGIEKKERTVKELQDKIDRLNREIESEKQELNNVDSDIKKFKETHFQELPNSYREATFQIALDLDLPGGEVVYKQYNGVTGRFESCTESDRQIKYGNDVHIPYLQNFN